MIAMRALVFLCLLAPLSSVAKIFERVSDLPKVKYDFIVIGGMLFDLLHPSIYKLIDTSSWIRWNGWQCHRQSFDRESTH